MKLNRRDVIKMGWGIKMMLRTENPELRADRLYITIFFDVFHHVTLTSFWSLNTFGLSSVVSRMLVVRTRKL